MVEINSDNIVSLRPNIGISPVNHKKLIGKRVKENKLKGELIKLKDFF